MKNNSSVFVIIPTFNSEKYICRTLKCLRAQTDQNFQILIIDDNSSDRTVKIAESFAKELQLKIKIKDKTAQKGAAQSLNLAFDLIKTPFFALIDADTYLANNWIESMRRIISEGALVTGSAIMAYNKDSVVAYLAGLDLESRYTKLRHGQKVVYLSTCDLFGRTEILRGIHLSPNFSYGYDHQLSYLLDQKNISFIFNAKTFCYHQNKASLPAYAKQQFLIGYNQFRLGLKYPKQAVKKDAISYWYLPLQPLIFLLALVLIFVNFQISIVLIAIAVLLNYYFLSYLVSKKKWSLLPAAILLVLTRMIVWIFAIAASIISLIFFR